MYCTCCTVGRVIGRQKQFQRKTEEGVCLFQVTKGVLLRCAGVNFCIDTDAVGEFESVAFSA